MTQAEILSVLATASIKSAAILSLAGLVNALWRSSSASSRHLVWTIGVAAALATPALGLALKQLNAPAIRVGEFAPPSEPVVAPMRMNANVIRESPPAPTPVTSAPPAELTVVNRIAPIPVPPPAATTATPRTPAFERIKLLIEDRLFYLWLAGALAALLPLIVGITRVRLLSRRITDIDDSRWRDILRRTPQISHLAESVKIVASTSASMPMTWGILAPTLLVPSNSADWPEWKCRNILLHELAHVERRDCLTQLLAQIACAVYWFNPLVWIAAHRMRVERELACDDRVISAGSPASDYASNLLDVARSLRAPSFTSPTAIAMARPSQLSGRLLAVLDATRNRGAVSRRLRAGISASAAAIVIPMSFIIPGSQVARPATVLASHKTPTASQRRTPLSFQTPVATTTAKAPSASVFVSVSTGDSSPAPFSVQQGAPCWANDGNGHNRISTSSNHSDGTHESFEVRYSTDDCSLEVTADGKFTLRPDLSDVESISNDGWFRVEERLGRDSRRIEIRRGNNGALDHQYWVNGDRTPYNDEARTWLARTLLSVERKTAIAASTRVPQLYKAGGLHGLMSEIAQMESPYAKSIYYKTFLDMGVSLDANTLNSVVKQATTDLSSSDYYLAEVLSAFSSQPAVDEATWRTFAQAAGTMKSDYYKSEVLKKVLNSGRLSTQTVGILLSSASGIKSDYYLAEILQGVASNYAINAETRQYYVDAMRHVQSDYYRGQILSALNRDGAWDARTSSFVLTSVGDIKSDYYRSEALGSLVKEGHVSDWPAFFNSVSGISSDYYKRETLSTVLRQTPLTRDQVSGVLLVATRMKSDNDISEVLSEVANNYRIDDNLRPAFEKAVDAIGSDYYRGNAMSALRRSMAR